MNVFHVDPLEFQPWTKMIGSTAFAADAGTSMIAAVSAAVMSLVRNVSSSE